MMEFMKNNLRYPEELRAKGTQGRVVVQFVINKDGSFSDMEVIRKVDPLMDAEALRVINAMPRWKPGMQDGKPVAVKYTVPVMFSLGKEETRIPSTGQVTYDKDKVLIVIDGVMKEGMKISELNSAVSPSDIASVTVLKDEKATQLYGAKGKYGVFAIVTKAASYDAEGNVKVQGMVTDEQGDPVIGATVTIAGSTTGVVSGADGKFTLSAPKDAMLEVGYVGYALAKVKAEPVVTVKLEKE